jgi:hypothetical protein
MAQTISPENYVMSFGKFKGMKAIDIVNIHTVDGNDVDVSTGLNYLEWLLEPEQKWFKHSDIIKKIVEAKKKQIRKINM